MCITGYQYLLLAAGGPTERRRVSQGIHLWLLLTRMDCGDEEAARIIFPVHLLGGGTWPCNERI